MLDLLADQLARPERHPNRREGEGQDPADESHGYAPGRRSATKSYGANGPSSRTSTRPAQSPTRSSTACTSSGSRLVSASTATLAASNSPVPSRPMTPA